MSAEQRRITLTETDEGSWTAREDPAGRTAEGETPEAALDALGEADDTDGDDSAFARELSRKSIASQYGDDYFGENPDWADDLPDLGENA